MINRCLSTEEVAPNVTAKIGVRYDTTDFDNDQGFFVGQNSGEGNYYPGQWSRVDWVKDTDDNLYLCFTHFDQGPAVSYPQEADLATAATSAYLNGFE